MLILIADGGMNTLIERLRSLTTSIGRWAEKNRVECLAAVFFIYLIPTLIRGLRRMWFDELHTYYLARLPSIEAIWSALKEGADLNPPFLYLATRASHALFGYGVVATRLPEITGFALMCFCLYYFVSRRYGFAYGLVAMVFPLVTGAYGYAAEARTYGLTLGWGGLALVCWQAAAEDRRRRLALVGFTLSLAGALLSHCYAILIVIPFVLGEFARSFQKRKIDWPVLLCIAAASATVLVYLPLFGAFRSYTLGSSIFKPRLELLVQTIDFLLGRTVRPALLALLVLIVARDEDRSKTVPGLPLHELVCAAGFALAPVFALLLGFAFTGVYLVRYGMPAVVGFSVLFAAFVSNRLRGAVGPAVLVSMLFLGWFGMSSADWVLSAIRDSDRAADPTPSGKSNEGRKPEMHSLSQLAKFDTQLPIVISNGRLFLEADHYESSEIASRLHFLTNRQAALQYTGCNVFDHGFSVVRRWFPIRAALVDYDQFVLRHNRFLVYGPYSYPDDWLIRKLFDDGAQIILLGQEESSVGDTLLLEVVIKSTTGGGNRHGFIGKATGAVQLSANWSLNLR